MTEVHGEMESSNFSATPGAPSPVQSTSVPIEERTFKQSEVNDLVGRVKNEAIERYKRDSSIASHANYQQPQQPQYAPPQPPQNYQGMSEQEYRRIAAEEAQRSRQEWVEESARRSEEQNAQQTVSEFFTKVGAGEGGIQSFEKQCADAGVDLRSIPYHVQLSNMVENTREVITDLINNPVKIGQIQNLIDIDLRAGRKPTLALAEIKRLSESIKTNAKAANFRSPNEPLSQMRPSNAGTGNVGELTISDYKSKYKV